MLCVGVAPNNKLIVTGGNDKVAHVFEYNFDEAGSALRLKGSLKGHRRGINDI